MTEHELLWAMLPDGLEDYFELETFEKNDEKFRIVLIERNIIPGDLPKKYQGKKVINSVLNQVVVDDFPIRGRKGEVVLKKRSWKYEGIDELFTRPLNIRAKGTKLEKEFAAFLKELDRE